MKRRDALDRIPRRGRSFRQGVWFFILTMTTVGCGEGMDAGPTGAASERAAPGTRAHVLDYGPILRAVDARSARVLFRAAPPAAGDVPWMAGIEIGRSPDLDADSRIAATSVQVDRTTDFVAHVTIEGLEPQTRYTYVPLVNGHRAFADPGDFPSFVTPPELGERNADFSAVFLADQHMPDVPDTVPLTAYEAAARHRPLFWAQLGDVASGSLRPRQAEGRRSRDAIRAIWVRNYGDPASPQARFASAWPLNLATISDHEVKDNFSLNWHRLPGDGAERPTLHARIALYDRSIGSWWNHFGWGVPQTDRLGRVAREDHGESVMAEPGARVVQDVAGATVCVAAAAATRFAVGDFVYLADDEGDPFHTRISSFGSPGDCDDSGGIALALEDRPPRSFRRGRGARVAVGARYEGHGHYHVYAPFPFVEFFLLDTTSYRGDPYQRREYEREANRDTDHSRYPWNPRDGRMFIFGDREHGANRTTDRVRSWLGPTQLRAFLDALAGSRAEVLVVVAGYPLYSAKFEWSKRNWEGRESGFDFATEAEQIVAVLEGLDRLVLWVHGDGHTPMLVRLGDNLYQLQVGPTMVRHTETPGHRPRTLAGGDRSKSNLIGGGTLIAGHQPDLNLGDDDGDVFRGHLDQFEGFLRLYFHPGREVLRNSERAGLRRGDADHVVEIPADADPAGGEAGQHIVGKVVRLHFGEERRHAVVRSYGFVGGRVRLELEQPVVERDPDLLRLIVDGNAWVEAKWFDSRGREWRDFSTTMRRVAR
jgi:hypothetical protein